MAHRTVHLACSETGDVRLATPGSREHTYIQIRGVPDDISDAAVIRKLSELAVWPWPQVPVDWGRIASLPAGSLVRDLS